MTRIAIIGHFGGKETFLDGQTVKTKILYSELLRTNEFNILKIDTYYKKKNPLKLILTTLWALLTTKRVVLLVSGNGMKFYFPLLYLFSKVYGTTVYHDVIGGNLDKYVQQFPKYKKYLNSFLVNWVETQGMKEKLVTLGVVNSTVVPNFKRLRILDEEETVNFACENIYRFCIFSRVMEEKGVKIAVDAINKLNAEQSNKICCLDIYGSVDKDYKRKFDLLLNDNFEYVRYCGCVPFDECVSVLKKYYCLLFPTFWKGEGFPGTIVDAFSSGLPVIASRWGFNEEFIVPKENGLLFPVHNQDVLEECIRWSISHEKEMLSMRKNCIKSAKKYSPDKFVQYIINALKEGRV